MKNCYRWVDDEDRGRGLWPRDLRVFRGGPEYSFVTGPNREVGDHRDLVLRYVDGVPRTSTRGRNDHGTGGLRRLRL